MQKQTMYLTAEAIYRFLYGQDEHLDTLILCSPNEANLVSTDQSLYEALGSIEDKSTINYNRLVKLLEVTHIKSFQEVMRKPRKILTDKRVEEIRKGTGERENESPDTKNGATRES